MVAIYLALFLVIPILIGGFYMSKAKPRPPVKCRACGDGENLAATPIARRDGFQLGLRCPDCGAHYGAKISMMSLKALTEEEFDRQFPS